MTKAQRGKRTLHSRGRENTEGQNVIISTDRELDLGDGGMQRDLEYSKRKRGGRGRQRKVRRSPQTSFGGKLPALENYDESYN